MSSSFVLKAMADGGTRLLVIAVEYYDGKVVVQQQQRPFNGL